MALDVYVGGFSRYYAFEWENVAQKWARESGTEYHMIGPGGPPQPADWDEVSQAVEGWVGAINRGLGSNLTTPIEWDETREAPYFTDRPGYDCYGALLVWAAHAERGSSPPEYYDGEWYKDDAFIECSTPSRGQKYRPIVCGTLWLPGEFDFSFDFEGMTGEKVHICANRTLLESLKELKQSTFQKSDLNPAQPQLKDSESEPTLHQLAQVGLELFRDLAEKSVDHHLPLILST